MKIRSGRAAVVLAALLTSAPVPTGASADEPPPLPQRAVQIIEAIEFYGDDELAAIVCRTASILGVPVSGAAALEIGRRSRGTPRIANRLIRRVRDFAQVRGARSIELTDAAAALHELGIDSEGLDALDRRLLTMIIENFRGGPVGVDALAASLGEPRDTLEGVVEPFLLQVGLIARTPRGRVATAAGFQHMGLAAPTKAPTATSNAAKRRCTHRTQTKPARHKIGTA